MSHERARARVARLCEAPADDRTFRAQVLEVICSAIDVEAYVWLLTDPETSVGAAPLAAVPPTLLHDLPRLIRLKYLTATNRWTTVDAVARLSQPIGGVSGRGQEWLDLLAEHAIADVASVVFRDRFGCWGFLDLWRRRSAFTAAEATFLTSLVAPVTEALRRVQAATFTATRPARRRGGPVVLVLDESLTVAGQTPPTSEYLRELIPPSGGAAPIPAGAYNVAAQLLAAEAGIDNNPPWARVHLADGHWLTLRAARLGWPDGHIAVTIEEASAVERLGLLVRVFALTTREAEVVGHLLDGADTRAVARRLTLTENTVQDHLKSIFAKTGARNRGTLLARL